jgi:hypothetical protein
VGEQVSGILQRAHQTAEEITAQSRRESEERLEQARIEAAEIVAAAHQRVKELDADTDRIWIERHRIVDDARELALQLTSLAAAAAERFPASDEEAEPFAEEGTAPAGWPEYEGTPEHEGTLEQAPPTTPFDADATARFSVSDLAAGDERQPGSAPGDGPRPEPAPPADPPTEQ